jgi:hypothetical protein
VNNFRNGDKVYTLADIEKMEKRIAELEKELISSNDDLNETTHELGLLEIHVESIEGFFSDGENPAFEPFNEETLSIFWKKTMLEQQAKGVGATIHHLKHMGFEGTENLSSIIHSQLREQAKGGTS